MVEFLEKDRWIRLFHVMGRPLNGLVLPISRLVSLEILVLSSLNRLDYYAPIFY